jgi:hypothetical protein
VAALLTGSGDHGNLHYQLIEEARPRAVTGAGLLLSNPPFGASSFLFSASARPQRHKVVFQQFHDEVFVVRSTPAIAVDAANQLLAIVVDAH